jgi:hypothetical protein
MSDFLVKQAIQSVWCTPTQDQQSIIKLAKITRYGGVYTKLDVMWREYRLPTLATLYHCYQVGGISPRQLGLTMPPKAGYWMKFSDVCAIEETIVDFYNVKGIQSPRILAWYTVTDDGDLVVAIQRFDKVNIDYNNEDLFMRVYHNAYYGTSRHNPATDYVEVKGAVTQSVDDILMLQAAFNAATLNGVAYAFVNGYLVNKIDMITAKVGDVVEYVYDGSIYAVEDLSMRDLYVFDSTMDTKRKYLLHPSSALKTSITYQDDVDVFVMKKDEAGRFNGLYYHRNQLDAVRQVTHADYAIAIPYIDSYANSQEGWDNRADLTIRLHLRKSGYRRPLVNETNRIKELYKLPDAEILAAMIGIDSTVPEWRAAHLEAASYTKIMRSPIKDVTTAVVQDAFGYNAMSLYLAPTPQFTQTISNQAVVDIPLNLQYRSTVYEYNFDGKLLGWHRHVLGAIWRAQHSDTHLVQIISGYGVTALDEKYGQAGATLDANLDYRMYTCGMFGGLPDNNWQDVTGSASYVINGNSGGLTWVTSPHTTYTMVRSNRDFLGYDLNIPMQGGVLRFVLTSDQDRGLGAVNTLMQVAMGELDLFLNGWALVEGIDYLVKFPEIVIINKSFIDLDKVKQQITVRFCGHCKSDLTRAVLGDRGFVTHGVLSNNKKYDLRDDRVVHIAIGGAVYDRSELSFAETHNGVNVPGVKNGVPYVVRDIVVPMRGTTNAKTYELRDAALIVDKHVSDYMTLKLPPPTFTELSPIERLYPVYSPFVSGLLDDLKTGVLADSRIESQYNDDILRDICKYYEPLLEFEPTRAPNQVDTNYVSVQPYYKDEVTNLSIFQYRFLSRAVSLYLNNAVVLSHFVTATV